MAKIDLQAYRASAPASGIKKEKSGSLSDILNKDISLGGNGFGDKKKEHFYAELSILLSAGVDIKTALELITAEQKNTRQRELYRKIQDSVIGGSSFSKALDETGKFSPYEYHSIRIGEESGKINEVLEELARYYTGKVKLRRQVMSSLTYPAVVTLTALGAVFFMMQFVVPMFVNIFKRFNTELPLITKVIIGASDAVTAWSGIFILAAAGMAGFCYSRRKKPWYRKISSGIILHVPVLGSLIRKIYLARFCHSMNLLLSSRTPLVTSLELVKNMIGFYPMEQSLATIREQVIKGTLLHACLKNYSIYDHRMVSLIKVAEEVNRMDLIFGKMGRQYEEEIQSRASALTSLLEPVLIIMLGLIVGVILIAMYLPLFKLSSTVGG